MYCMMGHDLCGPTLWQRRGRLSAALAGRRRRWVSTDNIMTWHANCEMWELNSQPCPFSVPNARGPQKTHFCSALQKWQMRGWILFAPSILPWGIVLLLKFQILTPTFVEMPCLTVSKKSCCYNCHYYHVTTTWHVIIDIKLISIPWGSCWHVLCLNSMYHDWENV